MNFLTNHKQKVQLFETCGQYFQSCGEHNASVHWWCQTFWHCLPNKIQHNLDRLKNWTQDWLLQFNASKCYILYLGPNNPMSTYPILLPITNIREDIVKTEEEMDFGMIIDEGLRFQSQHVVSQANSILGLLKRTISAKRQQYSLDFLRLLLDPILILASAWLVLLIGKTLCSLKMSRGEQQSAWKA